MNGLKEKIFDLQRKLFLLDMKDKWDCNDFAEHDYIKQRVFELQKRLKEEKNES